MSAAIATFQSVKSAVQELRAAGTYPSADAIIRHLRGGSKPTVLSHLNRLLKEEAPPQVEMTPALLDIVRPALMELFAAGGAAEIESSRVRSERQNRLLDDMDQQLQDLNAERLALQDQVEGLSAQRDRFASNCIELQEELDARNIELQAARDALALSQDDRANGFAEMMARMESVIGLVGNIHTKRPERGANGRDRTALDGGLFQPQDHGDE